MVVGSANWTGISNLDQQSIINERNKYQILVENSANSKLFDSKIHLKVRNLVLSVVILGGLFSWASASPSSNIYLFLEKFNLSPQLTFHFVIMALLFACLFSIIPSSLNIRRTIYIQSLCDYTIQNMIFKDYVKEKIENRDHKTFENMLDLWKHLGNESVEDLTISETDFEQYMQKKLDSYLKVLPLNFVSNISLLILYNQCVENTLEQTHYSSNCEFTLILHENYWIV